jgi:hypothetical protein
LCSAWASGEYSDLVITCGGEEYNVHKVVACTGCEFFAKAIRFPGKVSLVPGSLAHIEARLEN